jgi:hypothetical protein
VATEVAEKVAPARALLERAEAAKAEGATEAVMMVAEATVAARVAAARADAERAEAAKAEGATGAVATAVSMVAKVAARVAAARAEAARVATVATLAMTASRRC